MGVRFGGMEKLESILMPHPHYMEKLRFTFVQIKFKIFEYFAHIFDFSKKEYKFSKLGKNINSLLDS